MNVVDRIFTLAAVALASAALHRTSVMAKQLTEIESTLKEIDAFTTDIAGDLDRLAAQVAGGATPEQLDAVATSLRARAEALRAVAAKVESPVPQPPPPVEGGTAATDGAME